MYMHEVVIRILESVHRQDVDIIENGVDFKQIFVASSLFALSLMKSLQGQWFKF